MVSSTWLRDEPAYRLYVRAFRGVFIGGFLLLSAIASFTSVTISHELGNVVIGFLFSATFVDTVIAIISWILVPNKKRINAQFGFGRMFLRDVTTGMPRTSKKP